MVILTLSTKLSRYYEELLAYCQYGGRGPVRNTLLGQWKFLDNNRNSNDTQCGRKCLS